MGLVVGVGDRGGADLQDVEAVDEDRAGLAGGDLLDRELVAGGVDPRGPLDRGVVLERDDVEVAGAPVLVVRDLVVDEGRVRGDDVVLAQRAGRQQHRGVVAGAVLERRVQVGDHRDVADHAVDPAGAHGREAPDHVAVELEDVTLARGQGHRVAERLLLVGEVRREVELQHGGLDLVRVADDHGVVELGDVIRAVGAAHADAEELAADRAGRGGGLLAGADAGGAVGAVAVLRADLVLVAGDLLPGETGRLADLADVVAGAALLAGLTQQLEAGGRQVDRAGARARGGGAGGAGRVAVGLRGGGRAGGEQGEGDSERETKRISAHDDLSGRAISRLRWRRPGSRCRC